MIKCNSIPVEGFPSITIAKKYRKYTSTEIIEIVCCHLKTSFTDIVIKSRKGDLPLHRSIVYYFLYGYAFMYKSHIALLFSRDHTTILAALQTLMDRMDTEEDIRDLIDAIKIKLEVTEH